MNSKSVLKYLIEQEVRAILKEENGIAPVRSFEEDPVNFILTKYPSLKQTLVMLMTDAFKDYITGIYIIAPKPTTFKIVLHNGQSFTLTFLGRAYEATVVARRYYLMTVGDKERAIKAIAALLQLGQLVGSEGPGTETTSGEGTEEASAEEEKSSAEEAPAEEETES